MTRLLVLLVQALALIYPASDPEKDITTALVAARHDHKRVLVDFGADWCPDCRVLAKLFDDPLVAPFVNANFHVVHVDIGRRDRNPDVVKKYGATSDAWIPAVVVLEPDGKTVAVTDDNVRLTRRTTVEQLLQILKQWSAKKTIAMLGSLTESGVRVDITLAEDTLRGRWLAATFTPLDPQAHLYAPESRSGGNQGLGRPTRFSIVSAEDLIELAPASANRRVEHDVIDALQVDLPIYPTGPVTLSVPIRTRVGSSAARADVEVSYMACGSRGCLPPVVGKRMTVAVR